jgi:membrane protease YdiL (CAAX protease family)
MSFDKRELAEPMPSFSLGPALVEEMLFRGLAFGVLFWKAGWCV